MVSTKLLLFSAMLAIMASSCSAGVVGRIPSAVRQLYKQVISKDGYRFSFEDPNGSKREEVGIIMNPGTDQEELVVMGSYSTYDEKTGTETITMFTADKNGYQPRYTAKKNVKLSAIALKSTVR